MAEPFAILSSSKQNPTEFWFNGFFQTICLVVNENRLFQRRNAFLLSNWQVQTSDLYFKPPTIGFGIFKAIRIQHS